MAMRRPMWWISCAALALSSCYGNPSADEEPLDDEIGEGIIADDGGAAVSDGAAEEAPVSDAAAGSPGCSGGDILAQLVCQLEGEGADAGQSPQGLEDLLGGFADLIGGNDAGAAGQIDFQGLLEGLRGGAEGSGGMTGTEGRLGGRNRDAGAAPPRGNQGWRGFGRARDAGTGADASVPGSGADGETLEPPAADMAAEDAGSDEGDVAPMTSVDSGLSS